MGKVFYSFESYDQALDIEIGAAMMDSDGRIQKNAKKEITETAEDRVYRSHSPEFLSRRYGAGGILDEDSYKPTSSFNTEVVRDSAKGFTLHLYAEAQWQQLFGGNASDNPDSLTEAIENNGIYSAPPRRYMEYAETNYGYGGQFERDLVAELEEAGF